MTEYILKHRGYGCKHNTTTQHTHTVYIKSTLSSQAATSSYLEITEKKHEKIKVKEKKEKEKKKETSETKLKNKKQKKQQLN